MTHSLAYRPAQPGSCEVFAVTFEFTEKVDRVVSLEEALEFAKGGGFAWVDILAKDTVEARELLGSLELLDREVIDDMLTREPSTQHGRYERYIHGVVSACLVADAGFELERVDFVVSENST